MKNLSVFNWKNLFFVLTSLKEAKQSIYTCIDLFFIVINPKKILREILSAANLARAQTLCIHKITKIIIINKKNNCVLTVFHLVAPSLESSNNDKELLIIRSILSFSRNSVFWEKSYKVSLTNLELGDFWIF